jgi:hypothetical protein
LRADIVHDLNLHSRQLVADGPYRYTRNPLYVGVFLMALGLGLMASRLGYLFLMIVISIYLYRLIRREERELLESQGESYAAFYRAVPSIIPSLRPRVPSGGATPRWGRAFVGELFIWFYAVAELIYAVTLNAVPTLVFIGIGFAVNAWEILRQPKTP